MHFVKNHFLQKHAHDAGLGGYELNKSKNISRNGQEEGHAELAKNAKGTLSQNLFWFKAKKQAVV